MNPLFLLDCLANIFIDVYQIFVLTKWWPSNDWFLIIWLARTVVCCPPWTSVFLQTGCRYADLSLANQKLVLSWLTNQRPGGEGDTELQSGVSALLQCCIPGLKSAETCSRPLIGQHRSRDLTTGLWLASSHLDTGLWLVDAQTLMDIMISQSRGMSGIILKFSLWNENREERFWGNPWL